MALLAIGLLVACLLANRRKLAQTTHPATEQKSSGKNRKSSLPAQSASASEESGSEVEGERWDRRGAGDRREERLRMLK